MGCPDEKFVLIKKLFLLKGLNKNLDKLISFLCKDEDYTSILSEYD